MMTIALLIIAIVIGLIRKGRLTNLVNLKIKLIPLILVSFLIQMSIYIGYKYNITVIEDYDILLHFVSYIILFAGLMNNFDNKWFIVITLGVIANFMVIFLNGGKMPVSLDAATTIGISESIEAIFAVRGGTHQPLQTGTLLWFLADIIPLGYPSVLKVFNNIYSIGDFIVYGGMMGLIQSSMIIKHNDGKEITEEHNSFEEKNEFENDKYLDELFVVDQLEKSENKKDKEINQMHFMRNDDEVEKKEDITSIFSLSNKMQNEREQQDSKKKYKEKNIEAIEKQSTKDIELESANDMKFESTNDIELENANDMKFESINDFLIENANDMKFESINDFLIENANDMKFESTNDIELENANDMKLESTNDIQLENANDMKLESTNDIQIESADDMKLESINDIQIESADDMKFESTNDIQIESANDMKFENNEEKELEIEIENIKETPTNNSEEYMDSNNLSVLDDIEYKESKKIYDKPKAIKDEETFDIEHLEFEEDDDAGTDSIDTQHQFIIVEGRIVENPNYGKVIEATKNKTINKDLEKIDNYDLTSIISQLEEVEMVQLPIETEEIDKNILQKVSDNERVKLMKKMKERKEYGYELVQVTLGDKKINFWKKDL